MTKRPQTTKIVMVGVLALALTVILLVQFAGGASGSGNPRGSSSPPGKTGESNVHVASLRTPMSWKKPDAIGPLSRNPMHLDLAQRTSVVEPNVPVTRPKGTEFTVTGIIHSKEQPSSVIIEGHILHEGDTIYGATVVHIAQDSVELQMGDKQWTVRAGERTTNQE